MTVQSVSNLTKLNVQGVHKITVVKPQKIDLSRFVRFFRSDWGKTMPLVTTWIFSNQIEKSSRNGKVSLFPQELDLDWMNNGAPPDVCA